MRALNFGAALICILSSSCASAPAAPSTGPRAGHTPFTLMQFEPPTGRVGYRMGSSLKIRGDDVPFGNTGGAFTGSCQARYGFNGYTGELPPGIQAHTELGTVDIFSGTPRQPGSWTVTALVEVECRGGPDTNVHQRQVRITFNIQP